MRVFVAADVPQRIRLGISEIQESLTQDGVRAVRWAPSSGLHLTLRFCGELTPDSVRLMAASLSPGAPMNPVRIGLGRLGVFPRRGAPRVLYVGLAQSESLASLAAWVEERVTCAGLAPEQRPFHPHLTLGRFREGAAPIPRDRLEMSHGMMQESIAVDRIGIFRSHLEPAGARYELLQEFPLLGDERR